MITVVRVAKRSECGCIPETHPHYVMLQKDGSADGPPKVELKFVAFYANDFAEAGVEVLKVVKWCGEGAPHTIGYWVPDWTLPLLEKPFSRADRIYWAAHLLASPDIQRAIPTAFRLGGGYAVFRLLSGESP